jgi:beta-galactosidase
MIFALTESPLGLCSTMKFAILLLGLAAPLLAREIIDLETGWRFHLGEAKGAESPAFDAKDWRELSLPHDWAFEADYSRDAAQSDRGGYKPGGIGWYRRDFEIPADLEGKLLRVEFDGAYMNSEVWINGHHLGKRPYGYISFGYDLTPHLVPGTNTLSVRLDNSLEPSARWYHGCGLYAPVRLVATASDRIAPDGIHVSTPEIGDDKATIVIETEWIRGTPQASLALKSTILHPDGKPLAETRSELTGKEGTIRQTLEIKDPLRWDLDTPHLYRVVSQIHRGNAAVDEVVTRFGIRSTRWEADTGFWLNNRNVKLLGVCEHLEGGPVGAAYPEELLRWKLRLLKDMGCNAIRVAHNPQIPAFYDMCDEMGILVMDEIFDGWSRKAAQDYGKQAFGEWWERDLRAWLKRNRNHPSVILWSLGNETRGPIAPKLVAVCHEMDPSRPTTSGHSGSEHMDVLGINGHSEKKHFFEKAPGRPFVSTEAPHTWQVRDFYRSMTWFRDGYPNKRQAPFPCPDLTESEIFTYDWCPPGEKANRKQVFNSSYDNAMSRITARKNWELMRDLPWHAGHFRWTGFDYLGEAGYVHGGWPFRAFMGGALDLAGFEKDLYYFYRSQWTKEPMVHILPHWTHPKMKEGTKIPVWVYSNCDEVELFLNGLSLGTDRPGTAWNEMQCEWMVPWKPGELTAIGRKDGREVARMTHRSAGAPSGLAIDSEGSDCPIVTVVHVDEKGERNPYADNRVHYHLNGPIRILSLECGNPVDTENNVTGTSRRAFFGKTRAFLRHTAPEGDSSLVIAAIGGDRKLMTSKQVSIRAEVHALRGSPPDAPLEILYSTDGSTPDKAYTGPFDVEPETTVKAVVRRGTENLITMEERFGPDQGLYWGKAGETLSPGGDQAEDAKIEGGGISSKGRDFHGRGFVDFGKTKGAWVEWYQENDGSAGPATLAIRYSGRTKSGEGRAMRLTVNGKSSLLDFPPTEAYNTAWKTLEVPIRIRSGANTIRLTTTENGGMNIDEITVR